MKPVAESTPSVAVSVVFFGAPNAGKSTLIGYLLASIRADIDVDRINRAVREQLPRDYRPDQYYAYVVDQSLDERIRGATSRHLGTSKRMHTARLQDIRLPGSGRLHTDVVVLDTPGSKAYYRDRIKGLSFGEIGVFVFEMKRTARWLEQDASFDEMIDGLIPLKTWLRLPSKPQTIVVLSKSDVVDASLEHVVEKWKAHAITYCGVEVERLLVVPTAIYVDEKKSDNVIHKASGEKHRNTERPLWDVITDKVNIVAQANFDAIENEAAVLAVDRPFSVPGVGLILQGKVISGCFFVGMPIRAIPVLDDNRNPIAGGIGGQVKSIKQADGKEVSLAVRGDVVGMTFGRTSVSKFKPRRGTVIIDQNQQYLKGRCLEIEIDATDASPELRLLAKCSIIWFGKLMSVEVIAAEKNTIVVESNTGSGHIFVMPCKKACGEMLTRDIGLMVQGRPLPIKGKLRHIGSISNIDISEAHIEHVDMVPGMRWSDMLRQKDKGRSVDVMHVKPRSVAWKEEN